MKTLFYGIIALQFLAATTFANPQKAQEAINLLDQAFQLKKAPNQILVGIDNKGKVCKMNVKASPNQGAPISQVIVEVENLKDDGSPFIYLTVISPREWADQSKVESVENRGNGLQITSRKPAANFTEKQKITKLTMVRGKAGDAVTIEYTYGKVMKDVSAQSCFQLRRQ